MCALRLIDAAAVARTLTQSCRGEAAGRASEGGRTVFKSVGSALEDLAAASPVLQAVDGPWAV